MAMLNKVISLKCAHAISGCGKVPGQILWKNPWFNGIASAKSCS